MPLTTGTFNLLSKTNPDTALGGPFQSNARNPKADRVSSKLVSFFSRTLQTYRAALLPVNTGNHLTPFTYLVSLGRTSADAQRAICTSLGPTIGRIAAGPQLRKVAQGRESLNFVK